MNLIYFGSPQFSAKILESILTNSSITVCGVVTQPDQPTGRHQELTPSPVTKVGQKYNLPIFKPSHLDSTNLSHIRLLQPDIFLVVSYGNIIPPEWLEAPKKGTYNIHFSLLPKYRGALCISEAIKNGDKQTGVTLMSMDEKLDHGNIITQSVIDIDINDNCETLNARLTQSAIELLKEYLPRITNNDFSSTPQQEQDATYTPSTKTRTRQNAHTPFEQIQSSINGQDSTNTHNLIRSQNPDPGAWTTINGIDIKIVKTSVVDNKLSIDTVQLAGKNPISWKQYLSGHPL